MSSPGCAAPRLPGVPFLLAASSGRNEVNEDASAAVAERRCVMHSREFAVLPAHSPVSVMVPFGSQGGATCCQGARARCPYFTVFLSGRRRRMRGPRGMVRVPRVLRNPPHHPLCRTDTALA